MSGPSWTRRPAEQVRSAVAWSKTNRMVLVVCVLLVLLLVLAVSRCTDNEGSVSVPPSTTLVVAASTVAPTGAPTSTTVVQPVWAPPPFESFERDSFLGGWPFNVSVTVVLVVIALLIAGGSGGAWSRLGLVAIGGLLLWLLIAPNVRPSVRTPSGLYRVSLGTDDALTPDRTLAAINTACSRSGAEGEIVNLGSETYNVLLLVRVDGDATYLPALKVQPGTTRAWTIETPPTARGAQVCTADFVEIRPSRASE